MTPRARIIIIVLAAVGLVVAFIAASSSDDDGPTRAATTAVQQAPAATDATTAPDGPATTSTTTPTTPAEPAEPEVPLVRVEGGRPVGGVQKLEFRSGEQVRFRVRSDTADEIHVHGYDVTKALPAGRTVTVSFKGELEGRFEVELHGAGNQIASLEVRP